LREDFPEITKGMSKCQLEMIMDSYKRYCTRDFHPTNLSFLYFGTLIMITTTSLICEDIDTFL
jgi:hypothetical protein